MATGGTDTHMITVDVSPLGLDGRDAKARCAAAGIILDTCALASATEPGGCVRGLRLGSAAVTTQGMGEGEMERIGALLTIALHEDESAPRTRGVREEVRELAAAFPPYPP